MYMRDFFMLTLSGGKKWRRRGGKSRIGILSAPPGGYGLFAEPDTQLGNGGSEWNVPENFKQPFLTNILSFSLMLKCLEPLLSFHGKFIVAKLVSEITSWHMQFYQQSFLIKCWKIMGLQKMVIWVQTKSDNMTQFLNINIYSRIFLPWIFFFLFSCVGSIM